jgi:IS5 family transposase
MRPSIIECRGRIVSISQPHIRPIVRGKAGTPVEFGMKISSANIDGYLFIDRCSWDPYNESGDLVMQAEKYKQKIWRVSRINTR